MKSEQGISEPGTHDGVRAAMPSLSVKQTGDAIGRAKYFRRKYRAERILALILLLPAAPLTLFLMFLVRLTSRGPGIYRQQRVGLHGEEFYVLKLRTMYDDAEADGVAKWCARNDRRITPLGRFLRKTHLDELPQLWNVVRGEMSLTGPRPERPSICEALALYIDDYYHRNAVKPGVTGLSQINLEPDRTLSDVHRKQCLDLHYIENASLWLDVRMLSATVLRMIGLRGVTVMRWMGLCCRDVLREAGLATDDRCSASVTRIDAPHRPESFEIQKAADDTDLRTESFSSARPK